jgi:cellulose synthase/poly-beta-1,6-N-acetylglucosamine synthase-like glycosyltransferase
VRTGVVIPLRGFPRFLEETLDAVLAEQPDDVVVVDDASFEPVRCDRARVVRRDSHGGIAAARATGLEALGDVDVVALCDADDTWEPGCLRALVAGLQAQPGAAAVFGRALVVGVDGRPTGERWAEPAPGLHDPAAFYVHNPIPVSCSAIRRSAVEAAGGFGSELTAEDWDLWLRLRGPLLCVPQARVRYRRNPGGVSADVARLARAQLALHERYAALAPAATVRRAKARDRRALAGARVRSLLTPLRLSA